MDDSILYKNISIPLSNTELRNRLNKMMVKYNPEIKEKNYLIQKYTEALKDPSKVQWIQHELDNDKKHNHIHLKRQTMQTHSRINLTNLDKTNKMDPFQIDIDNNKENEKIFVRIPLHKNKRNKHLIHLNPKYITTNTDNINIIVQDNKIFKSPEKKDLSFPNKINIHNNIVSNESPSMNYYTNTSNSNLSNNESNSNSDEIQVINITNINAKRNSLFQNKYQSPTKKRHTINNLKELTPHNERNYIFDNGSSHIITNTNNTSDDNTTNSTPYKSSYSPTHVLINNSSNPITTNSFYFQSSPDSFSLNSPSKNKIRIFRKPFLIICWGVLLFIFIKKYENIRRIRNILKTIINQHLSYVMCFGIVGIGILILYLKYKERVFVKEMFEDIKSELKEMFLKEGGEDGSVDDNGLSENEIIMKYSKRLNVDEDLFRKRYFPKLKKMRKKDVNLKEFECMINGKNQIIWSYEV